MVHLLLSPRMGIKRKGLPSQQRLPKFLEISVASPHGLNPGQAWSKTLQSRQPHRALLTLTCSLCLRQDRRTPLPRIGWIALDLPSLPCRNLALPLAISVWRPPFPCHLVLDASPLQLSRAGKRHPLSKSIQWYHLLKHQQGLRGRHAMVARKTATPYHLVHRKPQRSSKLARNQ